MNNGLKALLIAASTIITCMIVTLGFSLAREAKQIGNQVTEELEHYKTTLSERELVKYDGAAVYGADVINLLKLGFADGKNGPEVRIVDAEKQQVFASFKEYEEAAQKSILVSTGHYRGKVIRNKNDVITELQFIKIEEEK